MLPTSSNGTYYLLINMVAIEINILKIIQCKKNFNLLKLSSGQSHILNLIYASLTMFSLNMVMSKINIF
jgi:hypothetical protein